MICIYICYILLHYHRGGFLLETAKNPGQDMLMNTGCSHSWCIKYWCKGPSHGEYPKQNPSISSAESSYFIAGTKQAVMAAANWDSHWDTAVYTRPGCHCVMVHLRLSLYYPGSGFGKLIQQAMYSNKGPPKSFLCWADGSLGGWDPEISWFFSKMKSESQDDFNVETNVLTYQLPMTHIHQHSLTLPNRN